MSLRATIKQPEVRGPLLLFVGMLVAAALVVASNQQGRQAVVDTQRAACHDTAERSITGARRAVADEVREDALALAPGQPATAEHSQSAAEARRSARLGLHLIGIEPPADLRRVLTFDYGDPEIRAKTDAFCKRRYPDPGILPL